MYKVQLSYVKNLVLLSKSSLLYHWLNLTIIFVYSLLKQLPTRVDLRLLSTVVFFPADFRIEMF